MAKKVKTSEGKESVIETEDLREPTVLTVPGGFSSQSEAIFYFPRAPTPETKKEILKRKALGAILTFVGVALIIAGYSSTELLTEIKGVYLLLAVLGALGAGLFFYIPSPHLTWIVRGSMALVYLVVTVAILTSIISALGEFSSEDLKGSTDALNETLSYEADNKSSASNDLKGSMDALKDALPRMAEFLIIAGAILARAGGGVLKDSIRDLTDFSPAMIVLPGKFGR